MTESDLDEDAADGGRLEAWKVSAFLRDAPPGSLVRAYEGQIEGVCIEGVIVVECPDPDQPGRGLIEIAHLHNDGRIEITEAGRRLHVSEKV